MKRLVRWYRGLSFEERTIFHARFSIIFNILIAGIKIILGFVANPVFFATAVVQFFLMLSRWECFRGVTHPERKSFKFRNNLVATFLIMAGIIYSLYMIMTLMQNFTIRTYDLYLGTLVALVAFVEFGVSIKGCLNAYGRGHYYRNIKLISLCSAFTAISLAQMAIMSFAHEGDHLKFDGWFGVGIGGIIIMIGIYVFIAPKISILDRKHNVYHMTEDTTTPMSERFKIKLTNSRFYGNYYYVGRTENGMIDGMILEEKNPILKLNLVLKIIIIIFSEILIFPYAVGALIYHFKNAKLIKKLDKMMLDNGCIKILEREEILILEDNF